MSKTIRLLVQSYQNGQVIENFGYAKIPILIGDATLSSAVVSDVRQTSIDTILSSYLENPNDVYGVVTADYAHVGEVAAYINSSRVLDVVGVPSGVQFKLTDEESGYYAITTVKVATSTGNISPVWTLYNNNDTVIASNVATSMFCPCVNATYFTNIVVPELDNDNNIISGSMFRTLRVTFNTVATVFSATLSISSSGRLDANLITWLNALSSYEENPNPDPYEEAGGGEDPLPDSEIIGLPDEPTISPIDAGLFSLYSPTAAQMRSLADFLWTDFGGTGTTVEEVLEEVVEALKRSVSNPLNSMLGLSIIASQGLSKGSDSSVHVGFWDTGVSMTKLTKQYFNVNCGSLTFSPVCGNTFLDYAPYSKFMIFLPYVGMRLLDANDVVGHTISIRYRGDCVSGALTCYIIRDGSVIQEHTGNCALNIPLTADSWAETISSVGRIISGSVSGATRGGAGSAAAGAVRGAASVATNPSAFSPQVAHTGAVSGAAGHLGSQKPFILREAVRFHSTDGFNNIIGYPSYYYRKLGDCSGYTQCLEVHLSHTPCTGAELQEIEELLKKGVII